MRLFAVFGVVVLVIPAAVHAQSLAAARRQASALLKAEQYAEALPLLNRIVAADPSDAEATFGLGVALASLAGRVQDEAARRAMRVRARVALLTARELGIDTPVADVLIDSLPPDGADRVPLSKNAKADALMLEGEALFIEKRMDEALSRYARALQFDPGLYEAALFSGDVHLHRGEFAQAESWYQRAVAIAPARETAYRYSATSFMRQDRFDEARDRYVEAYISEPYNRLASGGLRSWMGHADVTIAHPDIVIPTRVALKGDGTFDVVVDEARLTSEGAATWAAYSATRAAWYAGRFRERYPAETTYRHSLAEEAAALRSVVASTERGATDKPQDAAIKTIKQLDDEDLLEAYVLLARSDEGIARDHPAYLSQYRDRLIRYVLTYMIDPPRRR